MMALRGAIMAIQTEHKIDGSWLIGAIAIGATWLVATQANAQANAQVNPQGNTQATASGGGDLTEIVVTAQKRSERLQDVPLTVTEISNEDLSRAGVTSLEEIGNLVAGLTYGGEGATSQPAIRGVSTTLSAAGTENPVAVYVDGIYSAVQQVFGSDLPDVDRVEVL